jgi:MoxR-like ATPase
MIMAQPNVPGVDPQVQQLCDEFRRDYRAVQKEIAKAIVGHEPIVDGVLTCLFVGGHALLEGVPGLGKTALIRSLAEALSLKFSRIQFTPDLMPADVIGTNVIQEDEHGRRQFKFMGGPIFAQIVLADEINRATPKTQSALLEAMQEKQVTAGGEVRKLEAPFFVMATQNPLEQEGTYPLPEAQLDRFLLQIDIGYPDADAERKMLIATTFGEEEPLHAICGADALIGAQRIVRHLPVGEKVVEAILGLVRAARPDSGGDPAVRGQIAWGPGPRASQAFMLATRARALLEGRFAPSIDDVVALAQPVLRHRMALSFSARAEGATIPDVIDRLCRTRL